LKRTNETQRNFRKVPFELESISGQPRGQPAYFVNILLKMSKNTEAASDAASVFLDIFRSMWCGPGSNRRHKDFQSCKLWSDMI